MNVSRETCVCVRPLTIREAQILERFLEYRESNKQIASAFNVSQRTVDKHFQRIMNKTGVRRRWDLVKAS